MSEKAISPFCRRFLEAVSDSKRSGKEVRAALVKRGMTRANLSHWFNGRAQNPEAASVTEAAEELKVNALWLATGKLPKRGLAPLPKRDRYPAAALKLAALFTELPEPRRKEAWPWVVHMLAHSSALIETFLPYPADVAKVKHFARKENRQPSQASRASAKQKAPKHD